MRWIHLVNISQKKYLDSSCLIMKMTDQKWRQDMKLQDQKYGVNRDYMTIKCAVLLLLLFHRLGGKYRKSGIFCYPWEQNLWTDHHETWGT